MKEDVIEIHFRSQVGFDFEENRRKYALEQLKQARKDNPNCNVWMSACGSAIHIEERDFGHHSMELALAEITWKRRREERRQREKTWYMKLYRKIQRKLGVKVKGLA